VENIFLENLFFLGKKKRPMEAIFLVLEKNILRKNFGTESGK
jgi:hypothetical protein